MTIITIAAQRPLGKEPGHAPGDPVSQVFMTMEWPVDRKLAKPFSTELNTCKGHPSGGIHCISSLASQKFNLKKCV